MVALVLLVSAAVVAVQAAVIVAQRRTLAVPADVTGTAGERIEVITIEIRNHVELAAERTGLARPLHRVAPGLIRSLVHKETIKLLRSELADQGVDADVRLRRLPRSAESRPGAVEQPDEVEISSG